MRVGCVSDWRLTSCLRVGQVQIHQLHELFRLYDLDNSGSISPSEMQAMPLNYRFNIRRYHSCNHGS